ncbi:MAG: RNA pseudouridine synthase, partial [Bacteroidota bacterium]
MTKIEKEVEWPSVFPYPHDYDPHPLAIQAADYLQSYLLNQQDWEHDFGLGQAPSPMAMGKMFGVLVVKDKDGKLGFLAAFSGKLAERYSWPYFVPPIYNLDEPGGFFRTGEKEIEAFTEQIQQLEKDPALAAAKAFLMAERERAETEIRFQKHNMKAAKELRKKKRAAAVGLSYQALVELEEKLNKESARFHFAYKDLRRYWASRLSNAEQEVEQREGKIVSLKEQRRNYSAALQRRIFAQYQFLNRRGEKKNLGDIFGPTVQKVPPSGAGECAAPKLLQYAFTYGFIPITMAEFWWGQSPKTIVRQHGRFYPACRGKCEPILAHML